MKIVAYFLLLYNVNGGQLFELYPGKKLSNITREECAEIAEKINGSMVNDGPLTVACVPIYNRLEIINND